MSVKKRRAVEKRLDGAAAACAAQGAQLTALRRAVLALVLEAAGPLTAYQLLDRLKQIRAGAVPPTIYRSLDFLLEHGLIHKLERLNAFVACADTEHPHHDVAFKAHHDIHHQAQFLICGSCGTVAELEDPTITAALERAAGAQGFHPKNIVVELDGTCAACAAAHH
jgi:Fur family zinc uptake transcriptional regulator